MANLPEDMEGVESAPASAPAPPRAIFCADRLESAERQRDLEQYVFSEQYNPAVFAPLGLTAFGLSNFGYLFVASKMLGSGSNGSVYLFTDSVHNVHLALKYADRDDESDISRALLSSGCRLLREQPVGKKLDNPNMVDKDQFVYFMELAEGTLDEFMKTLELQNRMVPLNFSEKDLAFIYINIAEEIRRQLVCLYDLDSKFVYTDLKSTNVLYKCDSAVQRDTVRFLLGDLGSATPDSTYGLYIATYPPLEYASGDGYINLTTPFDREAALSWELGVLLLAMANPSNPMFQVLDFRNIKSMTRVHYDALVSLMKTWYGDDIALLLDVDPVRRRDIRKSLFS